MNLYLPLIIFGILIIITALLVILELLLGGSKPKTITINGDNQLVVYGDETVLTTLSQNKVFLPSACGGKATCGTCKFRLIDDVPSVKPTEEPFLNQQEIESGVRLSCQQKVKPDMKIVLPPGLLSAKDFETIVEHVEDLTYDIKLVRFKLINPSTIDFKPGQFMLWKTQKVKLFGDP